jgi:hypothetical protein
MGMAVLAVVYLTARPRKKKDPLAYAAPMRSSLAQQKALERDMQSVIVELHDLTRQMSAQIETRAAKLEILIRDADERLAALAEANANAPALATDAAKLAAAAEPVRAMRLVKDEPSSEDRWNEVYRLADDGATIGEICRQLNRPRGEVELILALRPKPRAAAVIEPAVAVG